MVGMGPGLTWCVLLTLSATLKVAYLQAPNAQGLADGNVATDGFLSICGIACIIGIVLAVIGVVILAAILAGIAYAGYHYWNINDKPHRIVPQFSAYKLKGRLGKGGFGVVYHVLSEIDGGEYALKIIKLDDRVAQEEVMREVRALEQLSHPGIVRYFNSWRQAAPVGENGVEEWTSQTTSNSSPCSSDKVVSGGSSIANSLSMDDVVVFKEPHMYLFIQMELCQKESLQDWLKSNVINRAHGEVFHLFDQISGAVVYLHSKNLMHRDLKPSNIFFTREGRAVLGDFGLATWSTQDSVHSSCLISCLTLGGEEKQQRYRQHTDNLGTNLYMSPELTSGTEYDQKVDVFALGVILFELYFPFHTGMERVKVLEDLRKYKFPPNFSSRLCIQADLVQWMMTSNPKDRPSVKDIRSSEQFKQLKENLQSNAMETIPKL